MKNILIVESANDKHFVEAFIRHLGIKNTEVAENFLIKIDGYEEMEGLNPEKLKEALRNIKSKSRKEAIEKVGIIIDRDNHTQENRLALLNDAIQTVFQTDGLLSDINRFITVQVDKYTDLQIACCFTHVGGEGELETVLKEIKSEKSQYADCLESWQKCLEDCKVSPLKKKDFDKFWVQIYIRYDTCSKNDTKQAGRKCNNEAAMSKPIWNFEHNCLSELKIFLNLFSTKF